MKRERRRGEGAMGTRGLEQQGHNHDVCFRATCRKVFKSKHCFEAPPSRQPICAITRTV